MRIMIVDDSSIGRMMLKMYLKFTDYEVVAQAASGGDAIELYRIFVPDLVTLDISMPKMNGLKALEGMLEINPEAKVLMVSTLANRATVVKALNLGAAGYLTKPLTEAKLLGTILQILGE